MGVSLHCTMSHQLTSQSLRDLPEMLTNDRHLAASLGATYQIWHGTKQETFAPLWGFEQYTGVEVPEVELEKQGNITCEEVESGSTIVIFQKAACFSSGVKFGAFAMYPELQKSIRRSTARIATILHASRALYVPDSGQAELAMELLYSRHDMRAFEEELKRKLGPSTSFESENDWSLKEWYFAEDFSV